MHAAKIFSLSHENAQFVDLVCVLFSAAEKKTEEEKEKSDDDEITDSWTIEEKERLLQFVTKVFLMNFPSYIAYKHVVHSSLEVRKIQ